MAEDGEAAQDLTADGTARQLRAILASIAEGVNIIDATGRVVLVNHGFMDLYHFPAELAVPGTPLADFVRFRMRREGVPAREIEARVKARVEELLASAPGAFEERVPDGRLVQVRRQRLERGLLVSTYADITQARQREREMAGTAEALRASEERFRAIIEDQTEFISRFRPDFILTFVNQAYARQLARPREALLGTSVLDLMTPQQRAVFTRQLKTLSPERPTIRYAMQTTLSDGSEGWEEWTDRALFDQQGRLTEYQSVGRDITEERRSAAQLRASEARFRAIIEDQTEFISRFTPEFVFTFVNGALAQHLRQLPEQIVGTSLLDQMTEPQRSRFVRQVARLTPEDPVVSYEVETTRPDGKRGYEQWTERALFDQRGRLFEYQSVGRDITQQKLAEAELRETEEQLRTIAEGVPLPIGIFRRGDGRILFANARSRETFGLKVGGPGRLARDNWVRPEERDRMVERLLDEGRIDGFEAQLRRTDGTPVWVLISARLLTFGGAPAMLVTLADITERQEMEQRLKESEQRFRTIAEAHPVPVSITSLADQRLLFVNAAFRDLFGFEDADQPVDPALLFDPGEREQVFQRFRAEGRLDNLEIDVRHRDGTLLPVSLTSRQIDYQGTPASVTSITDLSEKKRAEAEIARQREALHQSEKISALGALLAGVAHELNNPLSVVVGQSVLLEELAADEATRARATKVRTAAERCARIIRTFLSMARSRPMARGAVDLPRLVDAALELLGYGLRTAGIAVERSYAPGTPPAYGDPDQLHQVLTNLIVNAQHALQEVEVPRRLRVVVGTEANQARVDVIDNGPGVDPELGPRVFEPFVTTKPKGAGTGIGLSVCQSIICAHDGRIDFTSTQGEGATFTLHLPLVHEREVLTAGQVDGGRPGLVGRILVVDDEPEIGEMYADILRSAGHEVGLTTRGTEALAMIEAGRFDLVLSDLRMPDLDGAALYRALAGRRHPLAARVIIITGDALSHQTQRLLGDAEVEVLEKPIDPAVLTARVRERLSGLL